MPVIDLDKQRVIDFYKTHQHFSICIFSSGLVILVWTIFNFIVWSVEDVQRYGWGSSLGGVHMFTFFCVITALLSIMKYLIHYHSQYQYVLPKFIVSIFALCFYCYGVPDSTAYFINLADIDSSEPPWEDVNLTLVALYMLMVICILLWIFESYHVWKEFKTRVNYDEYILKFIWWILALFIVQSLPLLIWGYDKDRFVIWGNRNLFSSNWNFFLFIFLLLGSYLASINTKATKEHYLFLGFVGVCYIGLMLPFHLTYYHVIEDMEWNGEKDEVIFSITYLASCVITLLVLVLSIIIDRKAGTAWLVGDKHLRITIIGAQILIFVKFFGVGSGYDDVQFLYANVAPSIYGLVSIAMLILMAAWAITRENSIFCTYGYFLTSILLFIYWIGNDLASTISGMNKTYQFSYYNIFCPEGDEYLCYIWFIRIWVDVVWVIILISFVIHSARIIYRRKDQLTFEKDKIYLYSMLLHLPCLIVIAASIAATYKLYDTITYQGGSTSRIFVALLFDSWRYYIWCGLLMILYTMLNPSRLTYTLCGIYFTIVSLNWWAFLGPVLRSLDPSRDLPVCPYDNAPEWCGSARTSNVGWGLLIGIWGIIALYSFYRAYKHDKPIEMEQYESDAGMGTGEETA